MGSKKTTTKATNPEWVTSGVQGLMGQVQEAGKVDPLSRVAPTNGLLDSATNALAGDPYADARKLIMEGAGGGGGSVGQYKASQFMQDYQNPFTKDVVDTALADYDYGAGQTRAQQDLTLAGSGAFGGSGAALAKSLTAGELARGRGALSAGIRSDAFNTAAGLGGADASRFAAADEANQRNAQANADRQFQAGGALAGLTSQQIGQQLSAGDYLRQIDAQMRNADYTNLGQQTSLVGQLPLNLFNGQTTKTSGGTLGAIGSGLLGAASLFAPGTGSLAGLFGGGALGGAVKMGAASNPYLF
jgi:hypothetical protein